MTTDKDTLQISGFNVLHTEAQRLYEHKDNAYHNFDHAIQVSYYVRDILCGESCGLHDSVLYLAAIWHDAVYFAGAADGVNEKSSAAALHEAWFKHKLPYNYTILTDAMSLIEQTSISNHLTNKVITDISLSILLDADLASLGVDYDTFCVIQDKIIIENHGDPLDIDTRRKSGKFLSKFLTVRPFIYHTDTARMWYEETAKSNITRYIQDNQ